MPVLTSRLSAQQMGSIAAMQPRPQEVWVNTKSQNRWVVVKAHDGRFRTVDVDGRVRHTSLSPRYLHKFMEQMDNIELQGRQATPQKVVPMELFAPPERPAPPTPQYAPVSMPEPIITATISPAPAPQPTETFHWAYAPHAQKRYAHLVPYRGEQPVARTSRCGALTLHRGEAWEDAGPADLGKHEPHPACQRCQQKFYPSNLAWRKSLPPGEHGRIIHEAHQRLKPVKQLRQQVLVAMQARGEDTSVVPPLRQRRFERWYQRQQQAARIEVGACVLESETLTPERYLDIMGLDLSKGQLLWSWREGVDQQLSTAEARLNGLDNRVDAQVARLNSLASQVQMTQIAPAFGPVSAAHIALPVASDALPEAFWRGVRALARYARQSIGGEGALDRDLIMALFDVNDVLAER